jgi:hypothetical protein
VAGLTVEITAKVDKVTIPNKYDELRINFRFILDIDANNYAAIADYSRFLREP